jgi:hypothetical protein
MAIVGHQVESGVRVTVERPRDGGPPWRYEGEAVTQHDRFRLAAVLAADGAVTVELSPDAPSGLADKVRLIVRSAWKQAQRDEASPPLRLARWRADR